MSQAIKEKLLKNYSKEFIDLLFYKFYTKTQYIADGLDVSRRTGVNCLSALEEEGFLNQRSWTRSYHG